MTSLRPLRPLRNQKGLAMLETVPLLVIFVVLLSFGMGFYGIIHTATLHSIAARTYALETFRQRTNLYYFRENLSGLTTPFNYSRKGWRYHAISHENDGRALFVATERPISLGRAVAASDATQETHNRQVYEILQRNERTSVNPAWVMVGYGMCLTPSCGN